MKGSVFNFINQNLYGYVRESWSYLKRRISYFREEPHTKFVIFGRGRSGSTLLVSLLNSCPGLFCDKEILNRPVFSPLKFVNTRAKLSRQKIYGFKLLSYQLRSVQKIKNKTEFIKALQHDGFKFIFLIRENRLRQCLSKMYATHRSSWHESKSIQDRKKMKVDLESLDKNLKESKRLELFEQEMMQNVPHITISYEKDLLPNEKHKDTINKICSYLNIPRFEPSTDLRRITTQDFSAFIENSDEMVDFLIANDYQEYLD